MVFTICIILLDHEGLEFFQKREASRQGSGLCIINCLAQSRKIRGILKGVFDINMWALPRLACRLNGGGCAGVTILLEKLGRVCQCL
jgi:hypothetical protein